MAEGARTPSDNLPNLREDAEHLPGGGGLPSLTSNTLKISFSETYRLLVQFQVPSAMALAGVLVAAIYRQFGRH